MVTFGLTPAWQQVMRFTALRLDEVNRATETLGCAAGKAVNAARAAAQHRQRVGDVAVVAPLGGAWGARAENELRSMGITVVSEDPGHDLRLCVTLLDQASGTVTELVQETPALDGVKASKLVERALRLGRVRPGGVLVCSGTLPPGVSADIYAAAVGGEAAIQHVWDVAVVDAKGEALTRALRAASQAGVTVVAKLNHDELVQTLGEGGETGVRRLRELGATYVVVTAGAGDVLLGGAGGVRSWRVPSVRRVNSTGCGDCLAGVLAARLAEGAAMEEALVSAMAAASASAETLLPAHYHAWRAAELEKELRR